ncbi:MAG: hypothetical protein MUC29_03660 [Pyrinomonadaceae bacterium]|jgi:hypothetical protein|nr:hypothetical protein [Pyrinomonadaceae bacterium]
MNGLLNRVPEIISSLERQRNAGESNVSLRQTFRDIVSDETLQVEHLFEELKINETFSLQKLAPQTEPELRKAQKDIFKELCLTAVLRGAGMSLSANTQDSRTYQTPEQFRPPVQIGTIEAGFTNDLVAAQNTAPNKSVNVPQIPVQDGVKLKSSSELANTDFTLVATKNKLVTWGKVKGGIKLSDEANRMNISLLQIYFEQLGRQIAATDNANLVKVHNNGDQANLSESAAVIGIGNTSTGLQYIDLLRAFVRMSRMGLTPNAILASEKMTIELLNMLENKQRQNVGSPLLSFVPQTMLPENLPIYTSGNIPQTQFGLVSTGSAYVQETSQALMLETDRDIDAQFNFTVASMERGYWNLRREARLIVDTTLQIDFNKTNGVIETVSGSNFFPAWFAPVF